MKQQPHFILTPTLRQHIDKIKAEVQETNSRPPTGPTNAISLIDQYTHQISVCVATLTALQKQRKYKLQEISALAQLKGHYRERPSNQFTGEALRRCGFIGKRDWSTAGRNCRWWQLK